MSADKAIRFDDKVAVVTGASMGCGRAYALELAKRGARVVVNARHEPHKVVDEITSMGGTAVANYDSVSTWDDGQAIVNTAIESFGKLDILINNGGIFRWQNFDEIEPADWDDFIAVHLSGTYNVTLPAFLKMRENRYGRIVMTSSDGGLFGGPGDEHYAASKMGVIGFMNCLEHDGKKHDIMVNTISPFVGGTRMSVGSPFPDYFDKAKTEFAAPIVLFLCSEQCPVSGAIFTAGMGFYRRVAVVAGPGAMVGGADHIPTPEEIHRHWEAINNINGPKECYNWIQSVKPMLELAGISL